MPYDKSLDYKSTILKYKTGWFFVFMHDYGKDNKPDYFVINAAKRKPIRSARYGRRTTMGSLREAKESIKIYKERYYNYN